MKKRNEWDGADEGTEIHIALGSGRSDTLIEFVGMRGRDDGLPAGVRYDGVRAGDTAYAQ